MKLDAGKNAIGVYAKTKSGYRVTVTSNEAVFVTTRTDAFVAYENKNNNFEGIIVFELTDGSIKEYKIIYDFIK